MYASSSSITSFAFSTFSFPIILALRPLEFSYIIIVTLSGLFYGAIPWTLNNYSTISKVPSSSHSTVFSISVTESVLDSVRLPIDTVPVSSGAS